VFSEGFFPSVKSFLKRSWVSFKPKVWVLPWVGFKAKGLWDFPELRWLTDKLAYLGNCWVSLRSKWWRIPSVIPPLRALSYKSPRARCFGPPVPGVTVGTTFKVSQDHWKVDQGHRVDRGHQGGPEGVSGSKDRLSWPWNTARLRPRVYRRYPGYPRPRPEKVRPGKEAVDQVAWSQSGQAGSPAPSEVGRGLGGQDRVFGVSGWDYSYLTPSSNCVFFTLFISQFYPIYLFIFYQVDCAPQLSVLLLAFRFIA